MTSTNPFFSSLLRRRKSLLNVILGKNRSNLISRLFSNHIKRIFAFERAASFPSNTPHLYEKAQKEIHLRSTKRGMSKSISTKSYRLFLHITLPFLWCLALACAGSALWSATIYDDGSPYEEDSHFPFLSASILYAFTAIASLIWTVILFILSFTNNPNPIKDQLLVPQQSILGRVISPSSVVVQASTLWGLWTASTIILTVRASTQSCVYAGNDYTCISDTILLSMGWIGWGLLTTMIGFFIAYSVAAKREENQSQTEFVKLENGAGKTSVEGKQASD